jgi:hypothetical protein
MTQKHFLLGLALLATLNCRAGYSPEFENDFNDLCLSIPALQEAKNRPARDTLKDFFWHGSISEEMRENLNTENLDLLTRIPHVLLEILQNRFQTFNDKMCRREMVEGKELSKYKNELDTFRHYFLSYWSVAIGLRSLLPREQAEALENAVKILCHTGETFDKNYWDYWQWRENKKISGMNFLQRWFYDITTHPM